MKKFIAFLLCAILILGFSSPISAADGNGDANGAPPDLPPSGSGNPLEERIAELEAHLAALTAALNVSPFVDHTAIRRQREEATQLERFMFHLTYYGVCLTISHNALLQEQRDLTARQLELEAVRLELGLTTQSNKDDLTAMLNGLERQIELNNDTIQTQRRHINTRSGRYGYEFIRDFSIPRPGSASVRSADALRQELLRNSAALVVLESHLNQAWRYNAHWSEIQLLEEQRDLLTRQLEMAAINTWNTYLAARAAHNSAVSERPLLQTRLELIENMYELGEISTVEKMGMSFAINAELHAADATAIALAMSIAEIDFMRRGIVGG
jgi:hypothetical protein